MKRHKRNLIALTLLVVCISIAGSAYPNQSIVPNENIQRVLRRAISAKMSRDSAERIKDAEESILKLLQDNDSNDVFVQTLLVVSEDEEQSSVDERKRRDIDPDRYMAEKLMKRSLAWRIYQEIPQDYRFPKLISIYSKTKDKAVRRYIIYCIENELQINNKGDFSYLQLTPYLKEHIDKPPIDFIKDVFVHRHGYPHAGALALTSAWVKDPKEKEGINNCLNKIRRLDSPSSRLTMELNSYGKALYNILEQLRALEYWWMKLYVAEMIELRKGYLQPIYDEKKKGNCLQIAAALRVSANVQLGMIQDDFSAMSKDQPIVLHIQTLDMPVPDDLNAEDLIEITYSNNDIVLNYAKPLKTLTYMMSRKNDKLNYVEGYSLQLKSQQRLGGELLVRHKIGNAYNPWVYVRKLDDTSIALPGSATITIEPSDIIGILLSHGKIFKSGEMKIGLFYQKESLLPLFTETIKAGATETQLRVSIGKFHLWTISNQNIKETYLGMLDVQRNKEQIYHLCKQN